MTINIPISKEINFTALDETIRTAFPAAVDAWDQAGGILYVYNLHDTDKAAIQAIVDAHDPALIPVPPETQKLAAAALAASDALAAIEASTVAHRVYDGDYPPEWTPETVELARLVRYLWNALVSSEAAALLPLPDWRSESIYK